MIIHENIIQGSDEWLALRANYFTASELPAAMGASKYQTRNDLLALKKTGIAKDVSSATQRIFDRGHATEALARPIAERILGEDLFPITASDGKYLASFDGLTMLEDIAFEHKLFNEELASRVRANDLEDHYKWQMDQQLMVSGAEKVLFMCSDGTEENCEWCWYERDESRFPAIIKCWDQFEVDLATYEPEAPKVEVVGVAPDELPALSIELTGMVTASNLDMFKNHALATIGAINRVLIPDQDFANAEKAVKWCKEVEDRTQQAKQDALDKTATIAALFSTLDEINETARATRLELDKLVKAQKESRRKEIIADAQAGYDQHIAAINAGFGGKIFLPKVTIDLASAIKGKRQLDSIQNAVDTEVARGKVAVTTLAESISANLASLRELAGKHGRLFADAQQLVLMANAELVTLINARITEAEKAEAERIAEIERKAAEKALSDKAAADKAESDRIAREAAAAEAKRLADEKAAAQAAEPKPEPTPAVASEPVAAKPAPAAAVGDFFGSAPESTPKAVSQPKAPCEPEKVTIPRDLYDELLQDQALLRALEAAGVDSWNGWSIALETLRKQAA